MARTDRTRRIAARAAREAGIAGVERTLAEMEGSALGSLLLEVFRERTGAISAADIRGAAEDRRFRPSSVEARLFHRFDAAAFRAVASFEALDVAPVAPLGACAALSGTDQNNVLTALRRSEVLADPTIALALAAAGRRRSLADRRGVVRLCTSARLLRTQSLEGAPREFTPHFRLFALASAGRDPGEDRFETDAITAQVLAWLRLADELRRDGFRVGRATVEISDMEAIGALCAAQGVPVDEVRAVAAAHRVGAADEVVARAGARLPNGIRDPGMELGERLAALPARAALRLERARTRVMPAIAEAFPTAEVRFDLSRLEALGYYRGLAFRVRLSTPGGDFPFIDGGVVGWTQALLADRKERLVASAIGTEALCKLCAP